VSSNLNAAATTAGATLKSSACAASKACLVGGDSLLSGAAPQVQFIEKEPDTTPGAILAKLPGEKFVVGSSGHLQELSRERGAQGWSMSKPPNSP
jgi:hypothetical protein